MTVDTKRCLIGIFVVRVESILMPSFVVPEPASSVLSSRATPISNERRIFTRKVLAFAVTHAAARRFEDRVFVLGLVMGRGTGWEDW